MKSVKDAREALKEKWRGVDLSKLHPARPAEDDYFCSFPLGGLEWIPGFSMVGIAVLHKTYGRGLIVDVAEGEFCITVAFSERECRFGYPDAFLRLLTFEREDYQEGIERFFRHREQNRGGTRRHGLLYDPIEESECYKAIEKELDRRIKANIGEHRFMGYCYLYWGEKRRILLDEYGIVWQSPSELNPDVMFD